ncbi:hypothetical protein [Nocardia brasiliensis]|uniref:hypothetical protein n=1 Tax=Nocardia brasiliensis TaxID=37326 RepID=UPI00245611F3|nr:hypothetical protein [Nocardia brasiliensis]
MSTTPAMDVYDRIVDLCIAIARYTHQDDALSVPEMEQKVNELFEFITPILWFSLPVDLVKNLKESFIHEHVMKFGTGE